MNRDETNKLIQSLDWIKVSHRLTGLQKVCDGILSYPNDQRRQLAEQAAAIIAQIRRAHSHGLTVSVTDLLRLEKICADADAMIIRPLAEAGAKHRAEQRSKGIKGAAARWSANDAKAEVDRIIADLQSKQYEDWTHAERWNEFLGLLDVAQLRPTESVDANDERKTAVTYEGGGRMTFGTFRNKFRVKSPGA